MLKLKTLLSGGLTLVCAIGIAQAATIKDQPAVRGEAKQEHRVQQDAKTSNQVAQAPKANPGATTAVPEAQATTAVPAPAPAVTGSGLKPSNGNAPVGIKEKETPKVDAGAKPPVKAAPAAAPIGAKKVEPAAEKPAVKP